MMAGPGRRDPVHAQTIADMTADGDRWSFWGGKGRRARPDAQAQPDGPGIKAAGSAPSMSAWGIWQSSDGLRQGLKQMS